MRTALLVLHISAGASGLILGPAAVSAAVRGHHPTGGAGAYLPAVALITVTAVALAALDPRELWPFAVLALGTQLAVAAGWWVERRRSSTWLAAYVRLIGGSYVSLVTALAVVSWGSVLAWVLPIVVGTALVEVAAHRAGTGSAKAALAPHA